MLSRLDSFLSSWYNHVRDNAVARSQEPHAFSGVGLSELLSVFAQAVRQAHLTRPSQGEAIPYRATIAASVQVRTFGCGSSLKLYNF